MFKGNALVIGASGGIGSELVSQLIQSNLYHQVHAVSRTLPSEPLREVCYHKVDSEDEGNIASLCQSLRAQNIQFTLAISCIGALHGVNDEHPVTPEKRLEDINSRNLDFYFATNAIIPAIWLKNVERLLKGKQAAKLVFLSARVGSINDNELGGWYGYRASKAALNMLIKTAQVELKRRAKNVTLVSYHPGTVDTNLSKPFQSNVPQGKLFTADFTVSQLLNMLLDLTTEDAPHYLDWQGKTISW
ncbi:SDR family NAD(P)-dependent oxidoreductase [Paraglaciecola marina]|uniref:SDR family NAD(P)-dependent oxidoreductase n=1 Tax=Paraglaciecola marina TaxID=2500157 RepID=UPI00105BF125|nr:SDR family NAD(P)-dependent oxidoreductase [Paraglaciecola marina]